MSYLYVFAFIRQFLFSFLSFIWNKKPNFAARFIKIPMNSKLFPFERVPRSILLDRVTADSLVTFADTCGLFLCQMGYAILNVNSQYIRLQQGDVFIYLPSTYVYVVSFSPDIQGVAYKSTLNFILPIVGNSINIRNVITLIHKPCFHLKPDQQERLERLISVIDVRQDLISKMTGESEQLMLQLELSKLGEALAQEVFLCYFSNNAETGRGMDTRDKIVQAFIISLMEKHKRQREVQAYAQEQFLTPRYFSSIIREKTGRTAQQWVIQVVISSMKQALLYTTKSLKEITAEYNFPTQSFFGKYFKQYAGMSPSDFRRQRVSH